MSDDPFQVFCWQWLNNSWIYRGDLSDPLHSSNYQEAQGFAFDLENNLPKFEHGWFYVGVYFWDKNHWEYQDGRLVWTQQPVGGFSQSPNISPPTNTINPNTETGMPNPMTKWYNQLTYGLFIGGLTFGVIGSLFLAAKGLRDN